MTQNADQIKILGVAIEKSEGRGGEGCSVPNETISFFLKKIEDTCLYTRPLRYNSSNSNF